MSTHDDLDPRIVNLLRDVPLSSSDVRDAHITQALAEIQVGTPRKRPFWLGIAAASVVLLAGGAVAGRISANNPVGPSLAADISSTTVGTPIKSVLPTTCAPTKKDFTFVGRTTVKSQDRVIFSTASGLEVYVEKSCELVAVYPHPPSP
jgi:hypothetical protein